MRAFARDVARRSWARIRGPRNLRFRSALRYDATAPAVLLSPHADDAVIDCWSVLASPGVVAVINVFAGVPAAGSPAYFERLAGARDCAEHMRRRLTEDRLALARAARAPLNLPLLSAGHRGARPEPTFAALDAAIAERAPAASLIYAPAALGASHPDHELVRAYALAVARRGLPVRLYADLPYCTVYGWPCWVTGERPDPNLDVDAYWAGPAGDGLCVRPRAHVVRLGAAAAAAKLEAMRTYRAEFSVLDRGPVGQLSNRAIHGYEVFWPVRAGGD